MEDQVRSLLLFGLISWTTTFLLLRKSLPKRSFGFCSRVVSTIHATIAVTLASFSVEDWTCPVCPAASKPTPLQAKTLVVTLSYLIYDLVCCFFDKQFNLDNSFHHLVSIVGIGAGLTLQKSGSELVAALWVTELSSPFLHLRELLKELGYRDTNLNLAADVSFAVIFTVGRMVAGPHILYATLTASNPVLIKVMSLGLQLVSAFWFYKIARMVKYKLTKRTTTLKKVA
ncbi:hypothetical protein FNV43_RR12475 [Rhamnella rubrinervis]|uniref:TLC domain-containing protein n=1 Tax=Rhamnella rubrinervis TaxID=2594499 RepID=A0A8K0MIP0_9ROSA|nr:hypothetical protein FNV43_RR11542 [Rhamnella rubrinervis]KAF3447292.1 hypothetical protein FNV43_RR12475 [Rhamnella rubrinervis]